MKKILHKIKVFLKRKKANRYDHIISLGYNCEVAFKFIRYFKFEETGIFNWCYAFRISNFINTVNNIEKIASEGFSGPNPLWVDNFSQIHFHGKANHMELQNNPELIQADLEDLTSRLQYLSQKFLKVLRSDERKLYIRKVRKFDIDDVKQISELYQALLDKGGKNFDLMIVAEEKYKDFYKDAKDCIFRTVDFFPPDDHVTDPEYFDNGWDRIFDEFYVKRPKNIKKKKYKFD